MKVLLLNLFILATVFLLSAALPQDKGKDRHGLIDSEANRKNEKPLQRRKPPIKVPGPKLRNTEDEETVEKPNAKLTGDESNMTQLSDGDKERKKGKDVNLTKDNKTNKALPSLDDDSNRDEKERKEEGRNSGRRNEQNANNEETKEERSSDKPGLIPKHV